MFKDENDYQILCMNCGKKLNKNQLIRFDFGKPQHHPERKIKSSWNIPEMVSLSCPYCSISDLYYIPRVLADIVQKLVDKGYRVEKVITESINRDDCIDNQAIQIWFDATNIPFDLSNTTISVSEFQFEKYLEIGNKCHNLIGVISNLEPLREPRFYSSNSREARANTRFKNLLHVLNQWVDQLPNLNRKEN